jgi:prepilin-type N-terminal cleavage/methylation domain-containing protein
LTAWRSCHNMALVCAANMLVIGLFGMVPKSRRGFTLIEILACLFVISLLIALLLPAAQQVREAARVTQCRSKLHQLSLAIHNYLDLHQVFPTPVLGNETGYTIKILPQMEQTSIYLDFVSYNQGAIQTHLVRPLSFFQCPSETGHPELAFASYYMNYGSHLIVPPDNLGNGFHAPLRSLSPRDVTDGLSNTAILSEVIAGNLVDPRARYWKLTARSYRRGEEAALADDCQTMPQGSGDPSDFFTSGWPYQSETRYWHFLPPNHRSCKLYGGDFNGYETRNSASWHAGMVQTAYADGSVRVTSSSIDRSVWWAVGSRNGGEVVP